MKQFSIAFFAIIIACLLTSLKAYAKGTVIVYGNGMFNEKSDAFASVEQLSILRVGESFETGVVEYDVSYNHNEFPMLQLYQVALQKSLETQSRFWSWIGSVGAAPSWFKDAMGSVASTYMRESAVDFGDLNEHEKKYRGYFKDGFRILLVSHSQGNFYANQAWNRLFTGSNASPHQESFGNVQVATPASYIASEYSTHTTLTDDFPMIVVRISLGSLPANVAGGAAPAPDGDPNGHSFLKAYMRSTLSSEKIIGDIKNIGQVLKYPSSPTDWTAYAHYAAVNGSATMNGQEISCVTPSNPDDTEYGTVSWIKLMIAGQSEPEDLFSTTARTYCRNEGGGGYSSPMTGTISVTSASNGESVNTITYSKIIDGGVITSTEIYKRLAVMAQVREQDTGLCTHTLKRRVCVSGTSVMRSENWDGSVSEQVMESPEMCSRGGPEGEVLVQSGVVCVDGPNATATNWMLFIL